jgi:tetratricopeptide (TPR) repeat protein
MENEPVEFEDEAPDRWTDEDAVFFEINKETQMWRVFRAMLLRMEGKLEMAKAEFDMAIASAHVVTVTMAAKLGLAHIKLEQLQPQQAFDIYEQLHNEIKAAKGSLLISDSEPVCFCPASIESDACSGAAQSLRHLGNGDAHEMFDLALQADPMCGDALWQSVLCNCKRNYLSTAKAALELLLKARRRDDLEVPQLHSIVAAGPQLRTTEMGLDYLRPSPAAVDRGKLVKSNEGKWRGVLQILGSGDTDALWFHLFAFIGQKRAAEANEAVSILMASDTVLPAVLDVTAFMQKHKIRKGSVEPDQRALLADFHVSLGNWFDKKLGMSDEAFAEYALALEMLDEKILSHRKVLWKLLWKRHKIFLQRERTDAAIFNMQECIRIIATDFAPVALASDQKQQEVNAKYAKYNFFLGTIYFKMQQIDLCSPLFDEAMKSGKYHAAALGYQGLCFAQYGPAKHSPAMHLLRESLAHGSDTLRETRTLRFQLAALLAHQGPFQSLSGSIEEYSTILETAPEDTEALSMRGGVYFMAEQTELAVADFSHCIELLHSQHSDDDRLRHALYSRARALQRLGKYHDAIKDFQTLQAAGMQTTELMGNYASAYESIGDFDEALSIYEKMITSMDKNDAEKYQAILHRRAALCSVCNQQEQALRDLNTLVQLCPEDVKARHQRGSMLFAKYSGTDISVSTETSREAVTLLRTALEDFQLVLKLQPSHVKARLRRKEVCNVLNETLPDDDAFDEDMQKVEAEELHVIEPDLVIDYALKMAADVQSGQKGSGQTSFLLLRLRGGKKNAQNRASWEEISFKIHADGRCEVKDDIFYLASSTCVRENFNNGLFSFRMCFTANHKAGVFTLATSKSQVRDDIIRYWHRFKDPNVDPKERFATPIRLLEKLYSLNNKRVDTLFHVAKLREYQQQYSTAKVMYLAVLAGLKPGQSAQETRQGRENSEKLAPAGRGAETAFSAPASRHVKGITEEMCKPVPGNTVANQIKGEVFYRLGIIMLEDPSIADSERARLEVAVWYLRVSVKIDASQKDSQFKLGMLLLRVEEFQHAATSFRAVTRIAPKSVEAWNNMGVALDRAGEPMESMQAFKEATALKPDFQSAICNLCVLTLRNELCRLPDPVQLSTVIRQLTEVIDSGDDSHPWRAFAYGLRGLAYQLRNSTKRGVYDADLAVENYLTAIHMDSRNLQGRVGIVCIYLDRQDLGAACPHLEWLVKSHPRSDIVSELLVWSRKIRLVFEDPISMFLQCLHMNPCFLSLSLTGTNVCIAPLQNRKDMLDAMQFESSKQSDINPRAHRKEGPCMSVYHYTQMACLSLDEGNMRHCLALMTKVLVLLPAKCYAIICAHVFRSLAFEKNGQIGDFVTSLVVPRELLWM